MPKRIYDDVIVSVEKIDPFDYSRLYGNEKYSLQNMELNSFQMPSKIEASKITSTWSDRIPYEVWNEAISHINSTSSGDSFFSGATGKSLLKFLKVIGLAVNFPEVTGGRVVRYTNVSSGYPVLRIDIVSGGTEFKSVLNQVHPEGYWIYDRHRMKYSDYYGKLY